MDIVSYCLYVRVRVHDIKWEKNVIESNFTASERQDIQNCALEHQPSRFRRLYLSEMEKRVAVYRPNKYKQPQIIILYEVCACLHDGQRCPRRKTNPENWAIVPLSMQLNCAAGTTKD